MAETVTVRLSMSKEPWLRALPLGALALYGLLTITKRSHAGVLRWRPRQWADEHAAWSEDEAVRDAAELEGRGLVLVDDSTAEMLMLRDIPDSLAVRSPKLRPALAKAIQAIESPRLRAVAAKLMGKLAAADPRGWIHPEVVTVLAGENTVDIPVDKPADTLPDTVSDTPSDTVLDTLSDTVSHTLPPAVSPPLFKERNKLFLLPGTGNVDEPGSARPIPPDFSPSPQLRAWAWEHFPAVDVDAATEAFVAYHRDSQQLWVDPGEAWRGWVRNASRLPQRPQRPRGGAGERRPTETPTPPPASAVLSDGVSFSHAVRPASDETRARLHRGWREFGRTPIVS